MSKSLLVIDTPETCSECPLFEIELYRGCRLGGDHWEDKPKWCPLRPLPEKTIDASDDYFHGYCNGRNECIDEILGETE